MSSTATTPARKEDAPGPAVTVFSAETDAALDESETTWLSAEEFSRDRDLGGWHRTKLQHAVARNECGLKQARRVRRFRNDTGRVVWEYVYPRWRVRIFLGFRPDGTPPPRRAPAAARGRRVRYGPDPIANDLAKRTGMDADDVISDVIKGRLQATLDPRRERFLFLDEHHAAAWIERQRWRRPSRA